MGEHETSLKVRDALAASQDAEILRLRGALAEIAQYKAPPRPPDGTVWDGDWHIYQHIGGECKRIARAALSSPAPHDDVIVPRALGWRLCSQNDGIRETAQRELRALLGAPARG